MLKDKGYDVKAVIAGSRMIRLTVTRIPTEKRKSKPLKWIFCDLRNVLPIGNLEKVGEMLKFPKLNKPEYLGKRAPETLEEKIDFRKYAMRDAEICFKAAKMIVNEFKTWRTTCSGLAIRVFMRDFWRDKEKNRLRYGKLKGYSADINEKFRLAYHGGRTECFIRGTNDEPIKTYDINSLYPFVMKSKPYPNVCKPYKNKTDLNLDFEGIANVKVTCDTDFPPICLKKKFGDGTEKLVFPNGTYEGWFTYPELRTIEENNIGKILKVNETYEWKETFNPFEQYITEFYAKKREADKIGSPKRNLYKIMLNGTYGKFGEHGQVSFAVFDGDKIVSQSLMASRKAWYHSVPLGLYIPAYARLENWQYLRTMRPERVYYTDTDCYSTSEDLSRYCGDKLGQLKVEHEAKSHDACFIRAKFYMINDEIVLKGFAVNDTVTNLRLAIFKNNFSRQEHRILKILEAQRLKMIPLTDCYITKKFSVEPDGKREYERALTPQNLLFEKSLSTPLTL